MKLDVRYLFPGKQIPTGPDTDALVAEYVFKIPLIYGPGDTKILATPRPDGTYHVLPYSHEEWAAMHILQLAQEKGWGVMLTRDRMGLGCTIPRHGRIGWWECNMTGTAPSNDLPEGQEPHLGPEFFAYQPTINQVLVQAALIRAAKEAGERGELDAYEGAGTRGENRFDA